MSLNSVYYILYYIILYYYILHRATNEGVIEVYLCNTVNFWICGDL